MVTLDHNFAILHAQTDDYEINMFSNFRKNPELTRALLSSSTKHNNYLACEEAAERLSKPLIPLPKDLTSIIFQYYLEKDEEVAALSLVPNGKKLVLECTLVEEDELDRYRIHLFAKEALTSIRRHPNYQSKDPTRDLCRDVAALAVLAGSTFLISALMFLLMIYGPADENGMHHPVDIGGQVFFGGCGTVSGVFTIIFCLLAITVPCDSLRSKSRLEAIPTRLVNEGAGNYTELLRGLVAKGKNLRQIEEEFTSLSKNKVRLSFFGTKVEPQLDPEDDHLIDIQNVACD